MTFQRVLTATAMNTQILPEVPIQGLTVAKHWTSRLTKK